DSTGRHGPSQRSVRGASPEASRSIATVMIGKMRRMERGRLNVRSGFRHLRRLAGQQTDPDVAEGFVLLGLDAQAARQLQDCEEVADQARAGVRRPEQLREQQPALGAQPLDNLVHVDVYGRLVVGDLLRLKGQRLAEESAEGADEVPQ